jgi:hypothetical protein
MQSLQQSHAEPVPRVASGSSSKPWPVARPRASEWLFAGAVYFLIAAGLQWKSGAFAVEFASNPDESAHYITGLMIRDYMVSIITGRFASPVAYAQNYYLHYPKVAIGMWPPLFHLTEGFWTMMFSPARVSVLFLMALITAAIATSIFLVLRRQYPMVGAFAGGALFVILPLVQASTQAVMADSLVALLDFWAMIFLLSFLEHERTRDAVLFGICAALSMATKANGVALILMPLFALLITRRYHLLRARGPYYAAAVVLVLGVPWQVLSYYLIQHAQGVPPESLLDRLRLFFYYAKVLIVALGWGFAPLFVAGLATSLVRLRHRRLDLTLSCALALLLSVWAYHSALVFGEHRYMLGALPPAILFIAAGFARIVQRMPLPTLSLAARSTALGVLAIGVFALQTWAVPRKPYQGFDQPASFLLSTSEFADANFLVVSDALGEGAFVSEVAMRDQRPDHIVLRSSKFLSRSKWNGTNYQLRFQSATELREFLDHAPIDVVILDTRTGQFADQLAAAQLQEQVAQALISNPEWKFRDAYPKLPDQPPWIKVYSRVGVRPPGDLHLDMHNSLNRDIVYSDAKRDRRHAAETH